MGISKRSLSESIRNIIAERERSSWEQRNINWLNWGNMLGVSSPSSHSDIQELLCNIPHCIGFSNRHRHQRQDLHKTEGIQFKVKSSSVTKIWDWVWILSKFADDTKPITWEDYRDAACPFGEKICAAKAVRVEAGQCCGAQ